MSRDSSVSIATGYGMDDREGGSLGPGRVRNVIYSTLSRPVLGPTLPPIQWVPGTLSTGVIAVEACSCPLTSN
jgi:hypothetical protein